MSTLRPMETILVLQPEEGAFAGLAERVRSEAADARRTVLVTPAEHFAVTGDSYAIDPANPEHWLKLLSALERKQSLPTHILHLANCRQGDPASSGHGDPFACVSTARLDEQLNRGLYSVFALIQAKRSVYPAGPAG
jgi:hypothetical protein